MMRPEPELTATEKLAIVATYMLGAATTRDVTREETKTNYP